MDYSSFYPAVIILFLVAFMGVILALILLFYSEIYLLKHYLKSRTIIDFLGLMICSTVFILTSLFSLRYFRDVPNIVYQNYTIATGTAVGWDTAGLDPETRGFAFKKDGSSDIIHLTVVFTPVNQGDRFEVIYLPNTGFGAIVQKI